MINWPAIIRHGNDPELTFIEDQSAFDAVDPHDIAADRSDYMVDAVGRIFRLGIEGSRLRPQPGDDTMPLPELLGLVKAHAAHRGSCCVAKLYAPDYTEAMKIVASLED